MTLHAVKKALKQKACAHKAASLKRFFKTGPGQYSEHDIFIGVMAPELKKLSKTFIHLCLPDIEILLSSAIHEERLLALFILTAQYTGGNDLEKKRIYRCYVKNLRFINNWDLIDSTAGHIVGAYLFTRKRTVLFNWACSDNFWIRRLAMVACLHFIKKQDYADALRISDLLLQDPEDLVQKAVGWMLREIGKRSLQTEMDFLQPRYMKMPRTMLRYAIEKFPKKKRNAYLAGRI